MAVKKIESISELDSSQLESLLKGCDDKDFNLFLFCELMEIAASVGHDGKGGGGFCGYIEKNLSEMTDETLNELSQIFDCDARDIIRDEIRCRANEELDLSPDWSRSPPDPPGG